MTWTLAIFLILSIPLPQNTTPDFHFQGKRTLIDRDTTDLDDGLNETLIDESNDGILRSPLSFDGSDFWYGWDGKAERLHPQHGAQLARGGTAEAGYLGCSKAIYAKGVIRIDDLPVGSHICVHTNEGRYAEMRIESFDRKKKTISFTFTTWKKNESDTTYQPH
ncbi:MAG TPA: hypothetical protein VGZ48_09415 [Candidatus Acidoferrales bacterium]|nr:hypothetical protein [Candidatus Acidoferrales bacterium]